MSDHLETLLNPDVIRRSAEIAERFARREPFRHVVIEDFFSADYAHRLLADFPSFERGNARNEAGELGNKSTVERVRDLSTAYRDLDELIKSSGFLDLIGNLTGVDKLLYDPFYFGGGTHENREGQDLDPHVDFNRHPIENWHRRLNLIVYLNPEWDDAWGGSLELHSDPRARDNRIKLVNPLFNRAVIFETTESSWHGFRRIELPEDRKNLSRRSIALYFYTQDRPAEELADPHSTIYVDRALPAHFVAGKTLADVDVEELRTLLHRRDQHNQRLYRDITHLTAQLEQAQSMLYAGNLGRLRYLAKIVRERLRR
ncbi:MAG: 2OG-Fe(II) oxygenase [Dokdonella sp.]|uniref:2OG-Fe(II) oxygenase n=1 Tax=Dokdonella sp. TaxID=2291710 RepID=UPI002C36A160|nr:2OG-Fe(II) oxygenase [Dokdonella sp.]HOX70271.1 2OG-Fe(II) oxygenase [Dokdonella sp.]HPG94053.1 2OG-Fe(II) oxygenase [Dokdonella sp.]HPN80541.1 2OG-Fe(II) oxygenase [Dokdonella sp.]